MHSFHHSRGRILFGVLCAFAIAASFVGAWMQTGATALLPAAAVAAIYGLVHAFDMRRPKAAAATEPQRVDFATDDEGELRADQGSLPAVVVTPQPQPETAAEPIEPAAPRRTGGRRGKAPGKARTPRAAAPAQPKVVELTPPAEAEAAVPMAAPMPQDVVEPNDEAAHPTVARLFEPEPFVRQQRAGFGRKAG